MQTLRDFSRIPLEAFYTSGSEKLLYNICVSQVVDLRRGNHVGKKSVALTLGPMPYNTNVVCVFAQLCNYINIYIYTYIYIYLFKYPSSFHCRSPLQRVVYTLVVSAILQLPKGPGNLRERYKQPMGDYQPVSWPPLVGRFTVQGLDILSFAPVLFSKVVSSASLTPDPLTCLTVALGGLQDPPLSPEKSQTPSRESYP